MNVVHVNFRKQRGFINMPNPVWLIVFGVVFGTIAGVALWEFTWWVASHITWR
jgi:hypothetical protein